MTLKEGWQQDELGSSSGRDQVRKRTSSQPSWTPGPGTVTHFTDGKLRLRWATAKCFPIRKGGRRAYSFVCPRICPECTLWARPSSRLQRLGVDTGPGARVAPSLKHCCVRRKQQREAWIGQKEGAAWGREPGAGQGVGSSLGRGQQGLQLWDAWPGGPGGSQGTGPLPAPGGQGQPGPSLLAPSSAVEME